MSGGQYVLPITELLNVQLSFLFFCYTIICPLEHFPPPISDFRTEQASVAVAV
jgi:hypothetical protein